MQQKGGKKKSHCTIIVVVLACLAAIAGFGYWWIFLHGNQQVYEAIDSSRTPVYDNLTGLEIANASSNSEPTFCIQIPNGSTDGARPQVGLDRASVVFEAIAETGITRFAAIYRELPVMVGPIRSLRPYYLDWDTPFDCTVVHDGGSDEALAAVGNGNYRNLDEDFNYMWKEDYIGGDYRYWNNVFTSYDLLHKFNNDNGYTTSNAKGFPHLTLDEVSDILGSRDDNPILNAAATVRITFTNLPDYNVVFEYNTDNNAYDRFYLDAANTLVPHKSYTCADKIKTPPAGCELRQVSPSAIAAIKVQEHTMEDNYHESIQTIGSGEAYIFQNGEAIIGTWEKSSQDSQIKFTDDNGEEIKFTPGQLWIAAVPQFGSVEWE